MIRSSSSPRVVPISRLQNAFARAARTGEREDSNAARLAKMPHDTIRTHAGGALRWLIGWIGWKEGLVKLTSIAAALRLRSEGYGSNMTRCV